MSTQKIVIIGGGAAGFFAAVNIAANNKNYSVVILEKTGKLLSKVRVSGGGRCNVTHACFENSELVESYPRGKEALKSIFSRFSTYDTIDWFAQRGIELKTEEDGRMFPTTDNSATIIECLIKEAQKKDIYIQLNKEIIEVDKVDDIFILKTRDNEQIICSKLIIATGGYNKTASYEWIKKLGHQIEKPLPSLFTFNIPNSPITKLMGVSMEHVTISIANTNLYEEGPVLITHWGLSGPAVLRLSAWGAKILNDQNYQFRAAINWLPETPLDKIEQTILKKQKEEAGYALFSKSIFNFPKRLWHYFLEKAEIPINLSWANLSKKQLKNLMEILTKDIYEINGKTTFKEEFVTCGGVNLDDIDTRTMESKHCKGLYFAGEVIDVDGITGGFNFQNAWSTAWIAAQAINKDSL